MKAKGSYNPVTQEAGGEYEVTRSDYQERRKDAALGGVGILIVLGLLIAFCWFFWSSISNWLNGLGSALTNPLKGISDTISGGWTAKQNSATAAVVTGANSAGAKAATDGINQFGEYYPVKTLTAEDYNAMLTGAGDVPADVVRLGNVITPNEVLTVAASAGADEAATVNRLGLNDAYVGLPDVEKGLVTFGAGVGKLFGVDLIQAGYDNRANMPPGTGAPPIGSDIRTGVGISPQPTGADQNMDGAEATNAANAAAYAGI